MCSLFVWYSDIPYYPGCSAASSRHRASRRAAAGRQRNRTALGVACRGPSVWRQPAGGRVFHRHPGAGSGHRVRRDTPGSSKRTDRPARQRGADAGVAGPGRRAGWRWVGGLRRSARHVRAYRGRGAGSGSVAAGGGATARTPRRRCRRPQRCCAAMPSRPCCWTWKPPGRAPTVGPSSPTWRDVERRAWWW